MPLNSLEAGSSFAVRPSNISLPLLPRWPSRSYLKWPTACTAMSNRRANVSPSVPPSSPGRQAGGPTTEARQMDDGGESSTSVELRTRTSHSPSLPLSLPSLRVSAAWARGEHAVDGRFLTRRGTSSRRPTSPTDSFIKPDGKWGRARRVGVNCRGRERMLHAGGAWRAIGEEHRSLSCLTRHFSVI